MKNKIYSLNGLDLTIQEKNKEVFDLLNLKVKEFIEKSHVFLVNRYKEFFKNDVSIEQSFSNLIKEEIIIQLYELKENFNNNYLNLMKKYFKDKLISSYTNIMNQKASEII